MDFVDEENLALLNVAQDADQVEFFLQHRSGGLLDAHSQLGGDDPGERGLAQARRAVEQHVVHGLAAAAGSLDSDGEVLLDLGLTGEIGELLRAERGFELPLFFAERRGNDALFSHEVLVY